MTTVKGLPVANVNAGSHFGPASQLWYTRVNKDDTALFGPLTWATADACARYDSKHNNSGLSQVVTYVDSQLFVVALYIRGRKTLIGRAAQFHSDHRLPPAF